MHQKRVVFGLFLLPINPLQSADIPSAAPDGSGFWRFREVVTASDAMLSTAGFLFTILTKTVVVEECKTPGLEQWSGLRKEIAVGLINLGVMVLPKAPAALTEGGPSHRVYRVVFRTLRYDPATNQPVTFYPCDQIVIRGQKVLLGLAGGPVYQARPDEILAVEIEVNDAAAQVSLPGSPGLVERGGMSGPSAR